MPYAWLPPPPLPGPHAAALAAALAVLDAREDLTAVLLCGSVLRGEAGPTSDLDLYCVVERPARQRRHLVAASVLVEVFLNPAAQIRRYMADERRENRPSTAHMLTTGHVLLDRRPEVLSALRAAAAALLASGPDPLAGVARDLRIYHLRDAYEDAVDAAEAGADAAPAFAACLVAALELHYALRRRWQPKLKRIAAHLRTWDAEAAALLAAYAATPGLPALSALVAHVLVEDGGLPIRSWDMPEEAVPDGPDW